MAKRRRTSRQLGEPTKKDFVALADLFCRYDAPPALINATADHFKRVNPRFDVNRFTSASVCGVKSSAARRR